ncbi:MAG: 2OG-Fe(II) oxygenase [Planctomycetota bacterium]|nr:2OG-Fe(II) oxygenase [Planctomycetota bacterium]
MTTVPKDLVLIPHFLTAAECAALIKYGEGKGFEPAGISSSTGRLMRLTQVRNNDRIIEDHEDRAEAYWKRMQRLSVTRKIPLNIVSLNERFRFYRYGPGQKFDWHGDGSFTRENGEKSAVTVLIYLNEGFKGGETAFKDHVVKPEVGLALLFRHKRVHQGRVLRKGCKYVLRTDLLVASK